MEYTIDAVKAELTESIPSLSPTSAKVIELANDINCSPPQLTKVIRLDPVLSAKVLKLVNSSYFSLSQTVVSLEKAVIMLGLNTIKNLALSAAVLAQMEGNRFEYAFNKDDFWKHSLGVGIVAKQIAVKRGIDKRDVEGYFVAGLIHQLGLLVENQLFPKEMDRIMLTCRSLGLFEVEEAELEGMNHCKIAGALAECWGLSPDLRVVMENYLSPAVDVEYKELVYTVHLAGIICSNFHVGLVLDDTPIEIKDGVLEFLGLDESVASEMLEPVEKEIAKAMEFLRV